MDALQELLRRIGTLGPIPGAGVIAIDGRAASGKTTLAERIHNELGAGVVHMDDFFLPPELRTPERLDEPGGNVHYERFEREVLPLLKSGGAFSYRVFDCRIMGFAGECAVPASRWRIVEGAYACHPRFGGYADLRVFADVDPETQTGRILARGGPEAASRFAEKWIPLEEAYLRAHGIRKNAHILVFPG